jgi:hypothetical protein
MGILGIGASIQTLQNWMASLGMSDELAFYLTALVSVLGGALVTVCLMTLIWRYRKALLRDRDLKLSRFTFPALPGLSLLNALRLPMPSFSFDLSGGRGILTALGIVGVAFGVAFTFVIATTDDTPIWPEAGAVYALPSKTGIPLAPDPVTPAQKSQTLEVRLADGTRLEKLEVDLQMGKVGLADCISIERGAGTGYLWVDTFTMDKLVAPTLILSTSFIHQLTLSGNVDGHHTGPVQNSTTPDITIESLRESGVFTSTGSGRVDRLLITLLGDAYVKDVSISGKCSVGAVDLDFIKAGTLAITNVEIGDDGNVNTAAVDIDSGTTVHSVTDGFTDKPIIVK